MRSNKLKKGVLVIIVLVPFMLNAQNNTFSPYSRYGLGDVFSKPLGAFRAMGGTSIGVRIPNTINFINPAGYSSQDSLSFIFDFGLRYSNDNYNTTDLSQQISNLNIDHLAISFPFTTWWYASVGIFPYSNVGYEIFEEEKLGEDYIDHTYSGNGGLNEFYLGSAFVPIKNLSLGLNLSFLVGNIEHNRTVTSPDLRFMRTRESATTHIKDMFLSTGIQYTYELNKNKYTLGVIFDNGKKMNTLEDFSTISVMYGYIWDADASDSITRYVSSDTIMFLVDQKGFIKLPSNVGVGFSYNHDDKLIVGFDFSTQKWSDFESSVLIGEFNDSKSFSFGINYTPNPKSIESYLERVDYRLGGHYYQTNLELNNTTITDYGISCGLGIPMKNRKTKVNLTYEWGVKGTTDNNLMKINYNVVSLSVSFYDRWFIKRKFD